MACTNEYSFCTCHLIFIRPYWAYGASSLLFNIFCVTFYEATEFRYTH